MKIPNYENTQFVDRNGFLTPEWQMIMQQLFQTLQKNAGNEGLIAPTLSSASDSVDPPAAGGQIAKVASATGAQNGTLLYDSNDEVLKVLLSDGTFHEIVTV